MNESPEIMADSFIQAINRHDIVTLSVLMSPGHCFIDSLGNMVEGREKMLAGWTGYFRMVPDYSISVHEALRDGNVVVLLGAAEGTYAPTGELRAENRWKTPAAFRATVQDGEVTEWRVYADNEPIRDLMRKNMPKMA